MSDMETHPKLCAAQFGEGHLETEERIGVSNGLLQKERSIRARSLPPTSVRWNAGTIDNGIADDR